MLNHNRIVILTLGLLLSPAGYGDDMLGLAIDTGLWKFTPPTNLSFSSDPLLLTDRPIVTTSTDPGETKDTFALATDFEFQHLNEFKRMSKVRSLSLLTFAEFRQTRFFLGVDTSGTVGLHFGGATSLHSNHQLEIARMPYLNNDPSDVSDEQPEKDDSPDTE